MIKRHERIMVNEGKALVAELDKMAAGDPDRLMEWAKTQKGLYFTFDAQGAYAGGLIVMTRVKREYALRVVVSPSEAKLTVEGCFADDPYAAASLGLGQETAKALDNCVKTIWREAIGAPNRLV